MTQHRTNLTVFTLFLGALLIQPNVLRAFDCAHYQQCCLELLGAYEEAGTTAEGLRNMEDTCYVHRALEGAPLAQSIFCSDAWVILSKAAFQDYLSGRIGFYPDACLIDPLSDADEVVEPEPEPEPEPDMDFADPEPDMDFADPEPEPELDMDFGD